MNAKEKIPDSRVSSRVGIIVLILGIVFAAANLRAPITSVGPIIETIRQDMGLSNTLAGMLTTIPLLAFATISPLAPIIARRFGLEYTIFGAMFLLAAGIFLRYVPYLYALFLGTALLGIAIAVCNVLLPGLVKQAFPEKVGLMTGTYSLSMNLWAAIASGVSIPITQGLGLGWRTALVCWILLSIMSIFLWIPQLRVSNQPGISIKRSGTSLWHSALAWKVALFMGLQSTVFYTVVTWLPSILHSQGISHSTAGWLLSLTQFVSLPATFIVPILAARSSGQRGLVGFIVCCLILGYIGLLSGITWLAPLFVIFIGIFLGAAFSLATMFFVLRTHNAQQAAELSGMAQSVGYLLAAAGPALFGFIHDMTHSWTIPILILTVGGVLLFIVGMGAGSDKYVTPKS
ncbi:CynX/NimT family MFS transporter [Peribacillus glennii]|uniref:MFS transporter n=1 Tax=Peribacillus glennii TaxID=2303991 RepID=A0A372LG65_9BACI|nr:MFS transporter [Peribacillus glennii]RFU64952.1 MFS transporter [Peribacillus glennii]